MSGNHSLCCLFLYQAWSSAAYFMQTVAIIDMKHDVWGFRWAKCFASHAPVYHPLCLFISSFN